MLLLRQLQQVFRDCGIEMGSFDICLKLYVFLERSRVPSRQTGLRHTSSCHASSSLLLLPRLGGTRSSSPQPITHVISLFNPTF